MHAAKMKMDLAEYNKKLLEFNVDEDDIGIITPYRKQVQKLSSECDMTEAKGAFKTALFNFFRERLMGFFRNSPQLLDAAVSKYLKITYDAEVAKHEKSKRPWKELKLGSNISKNIGDFLQKQMARQMTNRVFEEH